VAGSLSLVAGGGSRAAEIHQLPSGLGECWHLPAPPSPTLSEVFAGSPRDAGWAGFLLAQADRAKPVLWVQDRMAIIESGRIYPPGLGSGDLIHVEARDSKLALWAMEEGLRCPGLSGVIGELWGDPAALDFTATRRLAVAAERSRVPCWLVRLAGTPNLSGARMRWRITSIPSIANRFDPRAPGSPAWEAELFRARSHQPGRWGIANEAGAFHLAAAPGRGTLGEVERLRA
jgi:protein ImuA